MNRNAAVSGAETTRNTEIRASRFHSPGLSEFARRCGKDKGNLARYRDAAEVYEFARNRCNVTTVSALLDKASHLAAIHKATEETWAALVGAAANTTRPGRAYLVGDGLQNLRYRSPLRTPRTARGWGLQTYRPVASKARLHRSKPSWKFGGAAEKKVLPRPCSMYHPIVYSSQ